MDLCEKGVPHSALRLRFALVATLRRTCTAHEAMRHVARCAGRGRRATGQRGKGGKRARGQGGHGGEHRSAVRPSSASMLKRAPLGVRTLRSNGLWSEVVPPTKSIELRRAIAPPCVMPSACALHQHNRTTSHHVRARSQLHARTHRLRDAARVHRRYSGYSLGSTRQGVCKPARRCVAVGNIRELRCRLRCTAAWRFDG